MIDVYALSAIVFLCFIAILVYKKRDRMEFNYLIVMYRTKRFRNTIDNIAQKIPRFWRAFGIFGIIVAFVVMGLGVWLFFVSADAVLTGQLEEPGLRFIVPTASTQTTTGVGFIGIPFWFWMITIAAILIPHEFLHGLMARTDKVKLKSVGLFLLAIIPGAFVEPDETHLKKTKLVTRLRVFAAGSFINVLIGVLLILLAQNLIWASAVQPGLIVTNVEDGSPAYELGLREGMVVDSIGNVKYNVNFFEYSFSTISLPNSSSESAPENLGMTLLFATTFPYKPGENITVSTGGEEYNLTLAEHPDVENFPYMGIRAQLNTQRNDLFVLLFPLMAFISILSIAVGIFNILPIYPLDGGLMVEAVADKLSKKYGKRISRGISYFMIFLIFLIFFGPFLI
jgi:membrane-associated protease RseP (regulator of RpoE activity)